MTRTEWICENGHEGVVEGGFAQKNAPEKCPICGANVEENEEINMEKKNNDWLERWKEEREIEEKIKSEEHNENVGKGE